MNYEVIIHDDGSPKELQDQVYAMRDRISILSFNTGKNQGLPAAANHCIERASSDYVLFLNDDCFFIKPCLKDICNVLSKPYVGVISPANDTGPLAERERSVVNGTAFAVSNFLGGGSCVAFRKDVWKEVGGWDERSTSGQADNVFIYKILKAGYWKALMEGPERIKVGNFVYGDDYKPTQGYSNGNDCSIPKIFGISERDYIRLNHIRREACQYWVDGERTIDEGNGRSFYDNRLNPTAGLNDIPYWGNYFLEMYGNKHSNNVHDVNWTVAERHGHSKWKEQILNDFAK
jgi:glycosyltransferase involved in cell wall biosynthesis